ncbi:hypothetical protein C0V97_03595 [Asaia sp. W19]|uniref:DUF6874 family protein n=1 Tax=unclassified Asaia TaxID=2685023 RepID=UPI000F8C754D|nr:hypothetical protein [Asaia sp. W19]RUT26907.1 hypothetical protein C0V97_03595 [Asaia sp. W19]
MATVSFDISFADQTTINVIAGKAIDLILEFGTGENSPDPLDIIMDIAATHANGTPLRLSDMAAADGYDLLHDIAGIRKHLDRETGKLTGHFRPRFAAPNDALIAEAQGAK